MRTVKYHLHDRKKITCFPASVKGEEVRSQKRAVRRKKRGKKEED
jgi:hypothetical protein